MAAIEQCRLGARARIVQSDVSRVADKIGVIVEVNRSQRPPDTGRVIDEVTVDIPNHGEVVVPAAHVEIVG